MCLGGIKSHIKAFELHPLEDQSGPFYVLCAVYTYMYVCVLVIDGNDLASL